MLYFIATILNLVPLVWLVRWGLTLLDNRRNQQNRLVIANFDNFFVAAPTGKVAKKCLKLAWRCVFLLRQPGDALVVGKALPGGFLDYVETILGFRPMIYELTGTIDEPLDFIGAIRRDPKLMEQLRRDAPVYGWRLAPLISCESAFELGDDLGIPVNGTSRRLVKRGLIRKLNDKIEFAKWCIWRALETAGMPFTGLRPVLDEALYCQHMQGAVVIREACSAGGLGNGTFRSHAELLSLRDKLESSLEDTAAYRAMVGPLLEWVKHHFSVVMHIGSAGPRVVTTCYRHIVNHTESAGGTTPCPTSTPGLKRAIRIAKEYGWWLWRRGYRGPADMDFGSNDLARLVLFESNARKVLTGIHINLEELHQLMWLLEHAPVVVYDEAPSYCSPELTFEMLKYLAKQAEQAWRYTQPVAQGTITIVSPPDNTDGGNGWFSFACVAETQEDAERLRSHFSELLTQHAERRDYVLKEGLPN